MKNKRTKGGAREGRGEDKHDSSYLEEDEDVDVGSAEEEVRVKTEEGDVEVGEPRLYPEVLSRLGYPFQSKLFNPSLQCKPSLS